MHSETHHVAQGRRGTLPIPAADDWEGTQVALENDKTKAPDVGWK
jgi:hypothetical protein